MHLSTGGGLAAANQAVRRRVIITDDDPTLNELWKRRFEQANHPDMEVFTAINYDELVAALNAPGADPDQVIIIGNRDRLADIARAKREVNLRIRIAAFTDLADEARTDWHSLIELGDGRVFVWDRSLDGSQPWQMMFDELVEHIRSAFA